MISTYTPADLAQSVPNNISDELESGKIVFFPQCPVSLPSRDDMNFLREEMPKSITVKNISYHPEAGKIGDVKGSIEATHSVTRILKEHNAAVREFLERTIPTLATNWTVGTSSFRPMEEKGRGLGTHASNELIHVDAGAYGVTNGDRVLRFFININPMHDRVWATKGIFPDLYRRYGDAAGVATKRERSLNKSIPNLIYSGMLSAAKTVGFPYGRLIDTSPYDRLMRQFHNYMKDTSEFQTAPEGHEEFRFPPMSAWMVFTDMVSHACIEGQFALVDTFIVPLRNCRLQELAPINILKHSPLTN